MSDDRSAADLDSEPELPPARYLVGIDLGTTNSACCYLPPAETDTPTDSRGVRTFPIPQLIAPGEVDRRETLPSFRYQAESDEFTAEQLGLPWDSGSNGEPTASPVGVFARDRGSAVPSRLVASAKSWLCHSGVDRTADLLPWQAPGEVERISPVEASASYLRHIRHAWDAAHPEFPLAEQTVVLTLPASFDEIARELTVRSARAAGLPKVLLLEEPQAAFYAWIDQHADDWQNRVQPGQTILVCDIGGGTSDFSLIRVRERTGGEVEFHRIAVGEHLMLGGDNLDLALAHHLESRFPDGSVTTRQWERLVRLSRDLKEKLLGDDPPESEPVVLTGRGSGLIGGSLRAELTREETERLLLDGFLPRCDLNDTPERAASGFQEMGLPFASDPAITRHVASFLTSHREILARERADDPSADQTIDAARPDVILFNGGFFASPRLRERLLEVLTDWFRTETDPDWSPLVLDNDRLDLAVARGAAYFGAVREGRGVKIAAGLPRSYYLGLSDGADGEENALCVLPAGAEPEAEFVLNDHPLRLRVSEPVEFSLLYSGYRQADRPGDLVTVETEQMTALPPIRTVLKTRRDRSERELTVDLHARLTEIGTLDLWCGERDGDRRWKLQFDVRSATQTDRTAHTGVGETEGVLAEDDWERGHSRIVATFGPDGGDDPKKLAKGLSREWGLSRKDWPGATLRRVWETLVEFEAGRHRSADHEARWLNLLGFALRPGYGIALDDWRVAETWRLVSGRIKHGTPAVRAEAWILWRRVAGGLSAGQQVSLAEPILASLRTSYRQIKTGRGKGGDLDLRSHEVAELWRLLGSLEHLPLRVKTELGEMLITLLGKSNLDAVRSPMLWAVGRIGSRVPMYGSLGAVVPSAEVMRWIDRLFTLGDPDREIALALMQLARRTGDRYRDVSDSTRDRSLNALETADAPDHWSILIREGGALKTPEQSLLFGEALPSGLTLRG